MSKTKNLTTKAPKVDREYSRTVTRPETLAEAEELYGHDIVLGIFLQKLDVAEQNVARNMMEAGKTNEEIDTFLAKWKPGMPSERGGDPAAKAIKLVAKLDPEMAKVLEKMIQDKLKEATAGAGGAAKASKK